MLLSGIPQLLLLFALRTCPITLPTKVHAFQAHSNRPGRQSRQHQQRRDPSTHRAHEDRPPDKLGRFFDVEPQWEGSSYSYVRPTPRKAALSCKETKTTLEFPHSGTFTLEEHTYRVSKNGTTNTGFTLWSSAMAVASYLDDQLYGSNPPMLDGHITSLELGAGLGLPSLVIARSGVVHRVVTTDLPEILPLLELNLHTNLEASYFVSLEQQPGSKQQYARVETFALDWTQHQNNSLIDDLAPDIIVASDVVWNATRPVWWDFLSLLQRLRANYHAQCNPRKDPWVLMGYTQRRRDMTPDEERDFFQLLQKGFGMQARTIQSATNEHWPLTVLMELTWTKDSEKQSE